MKTELFSNPETNQTRDGIYHYLGLLALASSKETNEAYLEQQVVTELAESLDAEMGTHHAPIPLFVEGDDVISQNGDNLSTSLQDWKNQWLRVVSRDDTYAWFAAIAAAEADEMHDVAQFSRHAEVGATMLVISPFPEDAYRNPQLKTTVESRGFRPDIQRAFIRVYEKAPDGLKEHIQSVDSSQVARWNAALAPFGATPANNAQDLLEQRLYFEGFRATDIISRLVATYDSLLLDETGQQYSHGRSMRQHAEANSFVRQYPDLIRDTIDDLRMIQTTNKELADSQAQQALYKSKALLGALYEQYLQAGTITYITGGSISGARAEAGSSAASEGKVFYGCSGVSLATGESSSTYGGLQPTDSFSFTFVNRRAAANGLEIRPCTTCPICNKVVDAIYDPKQQAWSCVREACDGYNETMVNRAKNKQSVKGTKDFADLLVEFIFGNEQDQARKTKSGAR